MSYKRKVDCSKLAPPLSVSHIDSVKMTSTDNEVDVKPLDLSQVDKVHVEDMQIQVLSANGMLGNMKPYTAPVNMVELNDSVKSAQKFAQKVSDYKQALELENPPVSEEQTK